MEQAGYYMPFLYKIACLLHIKTYPDGILPGLAFHARAHGAMLRAGCWSSRRTGLTRTPTGAPLRAEAGRAARGRAQGVLHAAAGPRPLARAEAGGS